MTWWTQFSDLPWSIDDSLPSICVRFGQITLTARTLSYKVMLDAGSSPVIHLPNTLLRHDEE
jgi:hypothetical protein